jgi:HK97 family phage prohead protease
MTVTAAAERRAAADRRLYAANAERYNHGDIAYKRYRSLAPGIGVARRVPTKTQIRAVPETRNDKELVHTSGFFTVYDRAYPMWDTFGQYEEVVVRGAGAKTIAAKPDVAFLTNHTGMTMARTVNGTLVLQERSEGGWHDAWLNPQRSDVHDLVVAIDDKNVDQMSFAFTIPEDGGWWSDDFTRYDIRSYDLDRGDVSAVNYGASPYTDISARAAEVLDDIERLPLGALHEAAARLTARAREGSGRDGRIEVRHAPRTVDPGASRAVRTLQGRFARTAARYVDLSERGNLGVADLVTARLPWYEIRASEAPTGESDAPESTDVFIYDEIGGSMGVDAKTFAEDLNAISTPQINVRINSPGGSVFDGLAIHSSLMHHPSHVTTYVDGIAASAASVIALGGDEIVTMPGGQWMMHNASMSIDGQAVDLRKGATFLDRQSGNLAEMYAKRMNVPVEDAQRLMDEETWAFAEESVELGLSDRVGERNPAKVPQDMSERMTRKHDLTRFGYRYLGRFAAPAPRQTRVPDVANDLVRRATSERTTPEQPKGRSIALIEAQLGLDERS